MADIPTMDLTPEVLKTEEGRVKVNVAIGQMDVTITRCADMLRELVEAIDTAILYGAIDVKRDAYAEEFREVYQEAMVALRERKAASNRFLEVLAGH